MQELLRRVRVRLSSARVSTSGLISTLHHSGVRGPELRLLLDQLERFRAAGAGLAATLAAQQQPPEPFAGGPYLQPPAAPRAYTLAPPAAHPATAAGGTTERTHGGGSDPPRPWSPAPSSASAGPGVAFFAGGLALLAALLVGLSAGGPGQRLRLLPGRRYMALVPLPLERPG
jgi:hypothetical protein